MKSEKLVHLKSDLNALTGVRQALIRGLAEKQGRKRVCLRPQLSKVTHFHPWFSSELLGFFVSTVPVNYVPVSSGGI